MLPPVWSARGSQAERTSGILPAVPISIVLCFLSGFPGMKAISPDPITTPSVEAFDIAAAAFTAATCWAASPGIDRFFLIFRIVTGSPETPARATAVLMIWPPPSRMPPSIVIIS
jgi:hypothetical protein